MGDGEAEMPVWGKKEKISLTSATYRLKKTRIL